jgi:hypothetical protein
MKNSMRIILFVLWQIGMVTAMFLSRSSLIDFFVASALVFPVIGYFATFYTGSGFVSPSHVARVIGISLAAIAATAVGFFFSICVVFTFLMAFGGHHW